MPRGLSLLAGVSHQLQSTTEDKEIQTHFTHWFSKHDGSRLPCYSALVWSWVKGVSGQTCMDLARFMIGLCETHPEYFDYTDCKVVNKAANKAKQSYNDGNFSHAIALLCPQADVLLLPYAALGGHVELVKRLSQQTVIMEALLRPPIVEAPGASAAVDLRVNAAHAAVSSDEVDILKLMLGSTKFIQEHTNDLLQHAASSGKLQCLQLLHASGAAVTPDIVIAAASSKQPAVVQAVLNMVQLDHLGTKALNEAVTAACITGDLAVVSLLLVVCISQNKGFTALVAAAAVGSIPPLETVMTGLWRHQMQKQHKQQLKGSRGRSSIEGLLSKTGKIGTFLRKSMGVEVLPACTSEPYQVVQQQQHHQHHHYHHQQQQQQPLMQQRLHRHGSKNAKPKQQAERQGFSTVALSSSLESLLSRTGSIGMFIRKSLSSETANNQWQQEQQRGDMLQYQSVPDFHSSPWEDVGHSFRSHRSAEWNGPEQQQQQQQPPTSLSEPTPPVLGMEFCSGVLEAVLAAIKCGHVHAADILWASIQHDPALAAAQRPYTTRFDTEFFWALDGLPWGQGNAAVAQWLLEIVPSVRQVVLSGKRAGPEDVLLLLMTSGYAALAQQLQLLLGDIQWDVHVYQVSMGHVIVMRQAGHPGGVQAQGSMIARVLTLQYSIHRGCLASDVANQVLAGLI